ncbi:MAG TPA: choice-of-anchor tandem repeat GloVer-containing protein, partial [Rhodocyclaceae bacterium]|nr:choice-of-anchor tandem repeat GloVer-containing protein [Rhodocyclaceae bacterium]
MVIQSRAFARILLLPFVLLLFCTSLARAQAYQDLHDFAVLAGTPQFPWLMAQGRDGNLYGVTGTGGTHSKGRIFQITSSGVFTVIHNFNGTDGMTPVGGLTLGLDGDLYGMAERGGANGEGNIFKISTAGTFSVLYDFKADTDGGLPVSPLIVGNDGNFYGTSYPGAAFRMTPAGVVKVITKLPTYSNGALQQAKDGSFYAVSQFGGTQSAGAIFKINGTKVTTVHSFDAASGSFPTGGLVEGIDGNFYGTTTAGGALNGGVIYRLTPSGHYHVMYNWDDKNTANGYQAFAGLVAGADGNLYGATIWGGQAGYGVIFSMTIDGSYTVLHSMHRPQGDGAYATPMQHTNGELFGIT